MSPGAAGQTPPAMDTHRQQNPQQQGLPPMPLPTSPHTGTAYKPQVPSPLNPRSWEAEGPTRWRRRRSISIGRTAARRGPTAASLSPAQRLLRHKAEQAWRLQVLRRETLRARQVRAASSRPEQHPREVDDEIDVSAPSAHGSQSEEQEPPVDKRRGPQDEGGGPPAHYDYMFRMPEVGVFTTQRLVLNMGAKRMLPLVSPHEVLRSARARREREEGRCRTELRMA